VSTAQSGPAKPGRVYAARLVGLPIFDPQGDQVGKVRDLVVAIRSEANQPRVLGLVAEVFGRRRIFVPMTRVTHIDSGQVYTTGLLNMRRFEQRPTETLVVGQLFDRMVTVTATGVTGAVYDVAMGTATDLCSSPTVTDPPSRSYGVGTTQVTETATDGSGNTDSCTTTVTVTDSTRQRGREYGAERRRRQREDLAIAVDIIVRSVPAVDALVAALESGGGSRRLVAALRSELAKRRGGKS